MPASPRSFHPPRLLRALAAAAALAALPVAAQQTQPGDTRDAPPRKEAAERSLETITVTGERMARSLRDTASSVSAIDAEALAAQPGQSSVQEAIANVPNVVFAGTVVAPVIRGQDAQGPIFGASAFLGGTVPRATINVDGRYLSYNELVFGSEPLWDVDSIEVFRGPQTVSQGANSIAGAIVAHTKEPTFHREGAAQVMAGGLRARRASAVISGPLAGNELAARLAVDGSQRNTFIHYINPRFAKGATDQDFESRSARLKLLWRPAALQPLTARLTLSHTQGSQPTNESANAPYNRYDSLTLAMPSFKQWNNAAVMDVAWRFGNGVTLSHRASYAHLNVRRVAEPFSNGGALIALQTVTHETKLDFGDAQSPWRGVAGLFVNHARSNDLLYTRGVSRFDDRKRNLGVYGELSRRFGAGAEAGMAGRWLLTVGLRHQSDHIRRSGTTPFTRAPMNYDRRFHAVLPKVSLAYDLSRHATVGVLASRGYNPGGAGVSFAQSRVYEFGDETLWNYELFGRASLMGGRMLLTGNVFFTELRNSQRLLPDYLNGRIYGAVVTNADRARARGLEAAADWQASRAWRLKAALGLLNTRISRFESAGGQLLQGKAFSRAPRHTLMLGAEWTPAPAVRLALDARHTARYHSADDNLPGYEVGGHTVINVRADWQASRHVQVFAYINNLADRALPVWMHDDRTAGGIVSSMLPPRQIGVGVKASF